MPPLILIGIDGLKPEFINETLTPSLDYLSRCGVSAESLVPVYPTNTIPNMYTIVTVSINYLYPIYTNNRYLLQSIL